MAIKELTTKAVRSGVDVARLPVLFTAQALKQDPNQWPPALFFDSVAAEVKGGFGLVLGSQELKDERSELKAQVARRREAITLETVAAEKKEAADATMHERLSKNAKRKKEIEQKTDQIKTKARAEYSESKQQAKAAEMARLEAERLREDEERREREAEATIAELAAVGAQTRALDAEAKALAKEVEAKAADRAIKALK